MKKELIERIEVGSGGAASIEFTGIPQDGKDLLVLVSGRGGGTGETSVNARLNEDGTNANYSGLDLVGNGSSVASATDYPFPRAVMNDGNTTANTFGNVSFYISNYTSGSYKSVSTTGVMENNATASSQTLHASTWNNTDAVTSLQIQSSRSGFVEHSTASLYRVVAE